MDQIMLISSQLSHGYVGGTASQYILQRLGFDVCFLPTIRYSNHPGYAEYAKFEIGPYALSETLDAIEKNAWLTKTVAIMTGYFPSVQHVAEAARIVERLKVTHPDAIYLCDPILGDDPGGLYIADAVARAIRSQLVPRADFITPNRFELAWLSGHDVAGVSSALKAAHSLGCANVIATSIVDMIGGGECADLQISHEVSKMAKWQRRNNVPHGSGDVLAALFLGKYIRHRRMAEAFGLAVAGTRALINAAGEESSLPLVAAQDLWVDPHPAPLVKVSSV